MLFQDRTHAGRLLADKLRDLSGKKNVLVLALPRGGVPVAAEVARALAAPLDVFIVRKVGVPGHEELAMGAIASGGTTIMNADLMDYLHIERAVFDQAAAREQVELVRREQAFRGGRPPSPLRGKICIVVDDGIATGATMQAAVSAVASEHPQQIVVAAPVMAADTFKHFQEIAKRVVALAVPAEFNAVGNWYESFPQLTDMEVKQVLQSMNCS